MHLKDLACKMTVLDVNGPLNREITGIAWDARLVKPGYAFFAIQASGTDGHLQIENAVQRGAAAIICRRNGSIRQGATKIEVADTRIALAQAAALFYGEPARSLRTVLVTGETGSLHLASILKQMLCQAGMPSALISGARHEIGARVIPAREYPESLEIHQLLRLAQMAKRECCVIEAPIEMLAADRFHGIEFDALVLASPVAPGTPAFRALQTLFRRTSTGRKTSCTVFPADDAGKSALISIPTELQLSYGFSAGAAVRANSVALSAGGSGFTIELPGTRFPCKVPVVGRNGLGRVLAACAAATVLGIEPAAIERALAQLEAPEGHLQRVEADERAVFVDGARRPAELHDALASLREVCQGRLIVLAGCEHGTPGKLRYECGQVLARMSDAVLLTSDNPGREPAAQICSAMAQGLDSAGNTNYHFQPDREEAIAEAVRLASPGDIVLIAGKGPRKYQELAHTIVPFDDVEYARTALQAAPVNRRINRSEPTLVLH